MVVEDQRWRGLYAPGITQNTEHVFSLEVPARLPGNNPTLPADMAAN